MRPDENRKAGESKSVSGVGQARPMNAEGSDGPPA